MSELENGTQKILEILYPGKKVVFVPGWDESIVDDADALRAIKKVNRRITGRLGFFWRWYYRRKQEVDEEIENGD